jgi:CheY-like chemotaxis protein
MRVLVIDDDDIARELLSSTLEQVGCEVFELPSAIGATRMIFQRNIEVVVIDVMLPDIDGDKLARVLRDNPRGAKLAIVLVSSQPIEQLRQLASAARADAVVSKKDVRAGLGPAVKSAYQGRGGASVQQ